jgi:type II secretory pathway component GspD/PulD (secretin)
MPVSVLPIVSADRRFVRMTINFAQTQIRQSTVLFPINIPLQGVIQNGPGGVIAGPPVVLTQYIQQPTPETIQVNTTVVVPDGGTVVMGGMKFMSEGRNEYGPPVISKIPYLNRLFKNVGYGRDGQNLMIMVTPRILINREEEERQTGTIPEQD